MSAVRTECWPSSDSRRGAISIPEAGVAAGVAPALTEARLVAGAAIGGLAEQATSNDAAVTAHRPWAIRTFHAGTALLLRIPKSAKNQPFIEPRSAPKAARDRL